MVRVPQLSVPWRVSFATSHGSRVCSPVVRIAGAETSIYSHLLLEKLDSSGKATFKSRQTGSENGSAYDVAVDHDDNAVVVGWFQNLLKLGDQELFRGTGGFALKLDPTGKVLWKKQFPEGVSTVMIGPDGTIYLAGGMGQGPFDFGGGPIQGKLFVAAYDSTGKYRYAVAYSHVTEGGYKWFYGAQAPLLAVDAAGHVLVGANFKSSLTILGQEFTSPSIPRDVVLFKLDETGKLLWGRNVGGVGQVVNAVAVDAQGIGWITGFYTDKADGWLAQIEP